jgi:hypothetical protein
MKKETISILSDFSGLKYVSVKDTISKQSEICNDVFVELNTEFGLDLDMNKIKIKYVPGEKQIHINYTNNKILTITSKSRQGKSTFNYINVYNYYIPDYSYVDEDDRYSQMLEVHNMINKVLILFKQHNEYFNNKFAFLEQVNTNLELTSTTMQIVEHFKTGITQYLRLKQIDDILDKGEYVFQGAWIVDFVNRSQHINKIKFTKNITGTYSLYLINNDEIVSSSTRASETILTQYIDQCLI